MNVVQICNSDIKGGAARAASSINIALRSVGVSSYMFVQKKITNSEIVNSLDNSVLEKLYTFSRISLDFLAIKYLSKPEYGRFSFPFFGKNISQYDIIKNADIIHLHWINEGFLSIKNLDQLFRLGKPIVWTLHDMWAFTGGCHYASNCENYKIHCGNCPALKYPGKKDFSRRIFESKVKLYKNGNLNIVTCSDWLSTCAEKSTLLKQKRVNVIPNPIDTNVYKSIDKVLTRKKFNLPQHKYLILFGTMSLKDKRKGYFYLKESLKILYEEFPDLRSKVEVVVFGAFEKGQTIDLPFKTNFLGRLSGAEKLVDCYNSADVFVAPSTEDNLPNTVMESLACGVPVVAFNIGGMPDMIDHKSNGYLAEPLSSNSLANGIYWIFNRRQEGNSLGLEARKKIVNNFTSQIIGERYKKLYLELIDHS